jgi:hypothetical protein
MPLYHTHPVCSLHFSVVICDSAPPAKSHEQEQTTYCLVGAHNGYQTRPKRGNLVRSFRTCPHLGTLNRRSGGHPSPKPSEEKPTRCQQWISICLPTATAAVPRSLLLTPSAGPVPYEDGGQIGVVEYDWGRIQDFRRRPILTLGPTPAAATPNTTTQLVTGHTACHRPYSSSPTTQLATGHTARHRPHSSLTAYSSPTATQLASSI